MLSELAYKVAADATTVLAEPWDQGPAAPPGFDKVAQFFAWGKWAALVVGIAALIGFFAHLTWERQNGGGSGSMGWLGKILIGVVGVSAVGAIAGFIIG
jgi:hypothetical protein